MADIIDLPVLDLPLEGQLIDGFRLQKIIGEGRYARVHKAHDELNDRLVAIKFPAPNDRDPVSRSAFDSEIWASNQVKSPWIAETIVLESGRQTRLYSVMPYYEGEMLEQRLQRLPRVEVGEALEITVKLAAGIFVLNTKQIYHRDIKPANIILQLGGELKLLDLGVARLPGTDQLPGQSVPGTPVYMAPEMFAGARGDEQTEVYALGVTLYRMLTAGQFPYGETGRSKRPLQSDWIPPTRHRDDIPKWLEQVIQRATAIDPGRRYADVMHLSSELKRGK